MQGIRPIQIIIFVLMIAAALGAHYLKPTIKMAEQNKIKLDQVFPLEFGDWRTLPNQHVIEVPPELAATISKIYTETLSRTYVNSKGQQVMLSIAYGADQSDDNSVHRPDVCYPAQGFEIRTKEAIVLELQQHKVDAHRMVTALGNRIEPVTYWTTIGDKISKDRNDHKKKQLQYGLKQVIPDGMIFRVSSIENDQEKAFSVQRAFLIDLEKVLSKTMQSKVFGAKESNQ